MSQVRDTIRTETEAKVESLAGAPMHVNVLRAHERKMRDEGIALDIDVLGLSMLKTSVDWYLDLGVLQDDTRRKRLSPGRKDLIADGRLNSLQTRIRNLFYRYSHSVMALGSYRYMSDEQFAQWHPLHQELVAQFNAVRDEYIANYDYYLQELEIDYRQMAAETYAALAGRGGIAEQEFTKQFTLSEFADAVINKVRNKIPTPHEMAAKIKVVVHVATWMLPVEALQELSEEEELYAELQAKRDERDMFARTERAWVEKHEAIAAEARAKQYAAEAEATQQERVAIAEADAEIQRIRDETRAIKTAQLELARQSVQEIVNPFDEILANVRADIHSKVNKIAANIQKRGFVAGKQAEAIQNMVDMFRVMNTANDDELAAKIEELRIAMLQTGTTTKRDTEGIKTALSNIAATCLKEADALIEETYLDEFSLIDL